MSKNCKECTGWRGKEGSQEFQDWWEGHQHLCEANYLGSSGSMDASELLAIFERSVENYLFTTLNFWEMVIAKATNLLFRKLPMVIRRLGNWSVLAMFKNVLAHSFAL